MIIAVIAFVVGINRLIDALIHSKKDRIVPNIIGKSIADSLDILSQLNLYLKKSGEEFNPNVPAGLIISQTPPASSIIKEGKAVNVIISSGGEVIFTPNLINQTVRSAQLILRKNGLDLGEQSEKYSIIFEKGKITSQEPPANTTVPKDALVNIVVSLGSPPEGMLLMPDFNGRNITEAQEWANQNGIIIKNINTVKDTISLEVENTIIKQTPESDNVITKEKPVEFWISVKEKSETTN